MMHIKPNAFWQTHSTWLCVLLFCLLPACSALKLAYNNVTTYGYWTLNSYLSFNTPQSTMVKAELQAMHAWHRREELPRYIALLKAIRAQALTDSSTQASCAYTNEIVTRYTVLTHRFAEVAEKVVPTLTAAQVSHLQQALDKSNTEWRKEWLDGSVDKRHQKRLERAIERAERFYGPLQTTQITILKSNIANAKFDAETHYRYRLNRQAALLQLMERAHSQQLAPSALTAGIQELLDHAALPEAEVYAQYTDALIQDACKNMAEFHASTRLEQRQHLITQLTRYIDDFRALNQSSSP